MRAPKAPVGQYIPLSIQEASPLVQRLWQRGIDRESARNVAALEETGAVRKVAVGWWVEGAGWCPTVAILHHALKRGPYVKDYEPPTTTTLPFA